MKQINKFYTRLFRNSSKLLSGSVLAAVLNLLALSFTSKYLGPDKLGYLVLAQTFVLVVDNLINFQPWQALIKFGIKSIKETDFDNFRSILKITFFIDLMTAISAFIVAQLINEITVGALNWDKQVSDFIEIYAFVILSNLKSLSLGILRIYNKYGSISVITVIVSLIRLIGSALLVFMEAGIIFFLYLWIICEVINNLSLLVISMFELKQKKLLNFFQAKVGNFGNRNIGFYKFVWTSNIHSSIRQLSREMDILIIGTFLNSASVGIFKIVKNLTKPFLKIIDPFYQVIYPELVSFWEENKFHDFFGIIKRTTIFLISIMIVFYVFFLFTGEFWIELFFGREFILSKDVLDYYLIAIIMAISTFTWQPAMLASGNASLSLRIQILSTIIYYLTLLLVINEFKLIGVSLSYITYYIFWTLMMLVSLRQLRYKFYIHGR